MSSKYLQVNRDTESVRFLYCLITKNTDMERNLLIWYIRDLYKMKIVLKSPHKYQVSNTNVWEITRS